MMMRVNAVTMIRIAGAKDSTVNRTMIWIDCTVSCGPWA